MDRSRAASSASSETLASPMTGFARCLWASQPAVLTDTNRTSGSSKSAQEPVVKSCSLVPTASTTSARAATALAASDPVMPIGPA
jgi:hypothetical protein